MSPFEAPPYLNISYLQVMLYFKKLKKEKEKIPKKKKRKGNKDDVNDG